MIRAEERILRSDRNVNKDRHENDKKFVLASKTRYSVMKKGK
jgi:hypothetical protein